MSRKKDADVIIVAGEIALCNLASYNLEKMKFESARIVFDEKFKILTEKDFPQVNDITHLIEDGKVKLMERYQRKYNENYKN